MGPDTVRAGSISSSIRVSVAGGNGRSRDMILHHYAIGKSKIVVRKCSLCCFVCCHTRPCKISSSYRSTGKKFCEPCEWLIMESCWFGHFRLRYLNQHIHQSCSLGIVLLCWEFEWHVSEVPHKGAVEWACHELCRLLWCSMVSEIRLWVWRHSAGRSCRRALTKHPASDAHPLAALQALAPPPPPP